MQGSLTVKQAYSKIVPESIKTKIKGVKRAVYLNGTQMEPKDTLAQEGFGFGLVLLEVRDSDSNVLFFTYIEVEDD